MTSTDRDTSFSPWVEVRVPTFKRNGLLIEALQSLLRQTWTAWQAIVFDDAGDRETHAIVQDLNDKRIVYRANPSRLGASGNLNQCFQSNAYYARSSFACCLEDDNWLYPHALESNIVTMQSTGALIMMRNQDIYSRTRSALSKTNATTLGCWFSRDGFYEPIDLIARTFFYTGISNGALFWNVNCSSTLQDTSHVVDPSLQEYVRCWQIKEPLFVQLDAALGYSDPDSPTHRHYTVDKSFSRAIQHAHGQMLRKHGGDLISSVAECGRSFGRLQQAVNSVSNIASLAAVIGLMKRGLPVSWSYVIRGTAKRLFVRSPLKALL